MLDRQLTDGVVTVRPFDPDDRQILIDGRDDEFHTFMGEGSPEPTPTACITVEGRDGPVIVGWIDADDDRTWLRERELNLGYSVFAFHRGNGHATRALRLFRDQLEAQHPPFVPTLLIDPANAASIVVAQRAGFERASDGVGDQLLFTRRSRSTSSD